MWRQVSLRDVLIYNPPEWFVPAASTKVHFADWVQERHEDRRPF
jgi:hypothetical protein